MRKFLGLTFVIAASQMAIASAQTTVPAALTTAVATAAKTVTPVSPVITVADHNKITFQYGQILGFYFTSSIDQIDHSIIYYLPTSIAHAAPGTVFKTIVFLHGGGDSTMNRDGAVHEARNYLDSKIKSYAEKNQVILILPASPYGWPIHTSFFLRELVPYLKSQLPIDGDHLLLAGHSMGGMGVLRESPWLTDLFTGFLGLAAGAPANMLSEPMLLPYFNGTPHIQINAADEKAIPTTPAEQEDHDKQEEAQDHNFKMRRHQNDLMCEVYPDACDPLKNYEDKLEKDTAILGIENKPAFDEFTPEMQALQAALEAASTKYSLPMNFKFRVAHGTHSDVLGADEAVAFDELFKAEKQNFPKFAALRLGFVHLDAEEKGILPALDGSLDSAYWIKVADYADYGQRSAFIYLQGRVDGQTVNLNWQNDTLHPRKIILTLTPELLDLQSPVKILMQGAEVFSGKLSLTLDGPTGKLKSEVILSVDQPVEEDQPVRRPVARAKPAPRVPTVSATAKVSKHSFGESDRNALMQKYMNEFPNGNTGDDQ
jgi:hypothetical protein